MKTLKFRLFAPTFAAIPVAMVTSMLLSSPSASAASATWANLGNQWTTTTNWTPNGGPQASSSTSNTDIATFGNTGASFNAPDLTSNRTVLGLNFTAGANAYTFTTASGKILDVMTSGITNNSTAAQTFNLVVQNSNGNGLVSSIAGGSLLFNNGYNLTSGVNGVSGSSANRTVNFSGAGTITVAGTIANGGLATAGAVTVTSTGTTVFSGNNTYDGTTIMNALGGALNLSGDNSGADGLMTITAGTVKLGHANALGSTVLGTTVASGAVLDLNGQTIGSEALSLAGTGISSAGALVNTSGTAAYQSGAVTLTGSTTIGAGNISLGSTGESGGSRSLTKSGAGTLVLSGASTYTGLTTVNASGGAVTLGGNNPAASGGVTVTDGTLNINHTNALGSGTLTLTALSILNNTSGAAITNAGNNAITWGGVTPAAFIFGTAASTSANNLDLGSGTVTATTSRAMSFAGTGTTLTMGTLDNTSINTGRSFTFNGAGNTMVLAGIKLSNSATANVTDLAGTANLTVTGVVSNGTSNVQTGVAVKGTGITTFNGANTYTGSTAISSGATLKIGNDSALGTTAGGTTVSSGGVLDLNGRAVGAETLSLAGTGISSTGALINSNASAASQSAAVTLASNTTIGAGDITLGSIGDASAAKSLTKIGTGTLTLGGTNTYTGGTTIQDGTLHITAGNSALGLFTLAGTTPILKLSNVNALATTATLLGASASANAGTVDLAVAGSYSLAAYTGNNMKFTASSGSASTLTFTGNSVISSSTAGSGGRTITNNDSNLNLVFSGDLEIGSTVSNTVTIAGPGNTTVGGSVFNTGAGVRSLEKSGSGTLTLSGANSYNGATIVNAGKLVINGNSSTSTGNVSVATGATLGGSGLLGGATSVTGTLAPGNSIESLGLGALSFVTGSTYAYELNSSSLAGDLTYSSGSLNIAAGSILTLTELFSGTLANSSKLTLISSVGAWDGGLFTYNSSTLADDSEIVLGSNTWKFNYNDTLGGSNYTSDQTGATNFVTLTVIPEPNVAMVVGGLGVLALLRRRNR